LCLLIAANKLFSQIESKGFTEGLVSLAGEIGIQYLSFSHLLPISQIGVKSSEVFLTGAVS
jgi:hypothetical protein